MAWLAQTQQRLPESLRKRPRGVRCASLQAAHLASLFTRVTTDLGVFNSACGEPLKLHGPWEWFDGVLFEGMLTKAAAAPVVAQSAHGTASCWFALLRGDKKLLAVFELLRPIALAAEGETSALARQASAADESTEPGEAQAHDAVLVAPPLAEVMQRVVDAWREATRPA